MESDKYICVREATGENGQLSIISFSDPHNVNKRPINVESAIMNPKDNILALKCMRKPCFIF